MIRSAPPSFEDDISSTATSAMSSSEMKPILAVPVAVMNSSSVLMVEVVRKLPRNRVQHAGQKQKQ